MRLNVSTFGLLFASLLEVVVGQTKVASGEREKAEESETSSDYTKFTEVAAGQNIFYQDEGDRNITWSLIATNTHLAVSEVNLYKQDADGENEARIGRWPFEETQPTGRSVHIEDNGLLSLRQAPNHLLKPALPPPTPFPISVSQLDMTAYVANLSLQSYPNDFAEVWNRMALYMEVVLENETYTVRSYSPAFAVLNTRDGSVVDHAMAFLNQSSAAQKPDDTESRNDASTGTSPTASSSATSTSQSSAAAEGSRGGGSSSSSSNAGLSTGAIAGIVVGGVVAALAVAGFLVWFLCLRRRRRSAGASASSGFGRAHEGPYGAGSGAAVMMAEKEAAGLSESRDRPSLAHDRDHELSRDISGGVSGSGVAAGAGAAYAPYTDHGGAAAVALPPPPTTTPGLALTTTGSDSQASLPLHPPQQSFSRSGTATPPIESHYAHLIEEGMTEDEIRRLEEEERQLDAAIEEAGSRHSPPRT